MAKGWEEVKNSTLRKAWRKLWPAVMLYDADEDEAFEGFPVQRVNKKKQLTKELLEYVKQARAPEVKEVLASDTIEDDLEAWLDCDNQAPTTQTLTDEEIIEMVVNPHPVPDNHSDSEDDEDDGNSQVTWDDAQQGLEKFISFMETRNEFTTQEVMNQYMLHSRFLSYRRASSKQLTLQETFKRAARQTPTPTSTPTPGCSSSPQPSTSFSAEDDLQEEELPALDQEEAVDTPSPMPDIGLLNPSSPPAATTVPADVTDASPNH